MKNFLSNFLTLTGRGVPSSIERVSGMRPSSRSPPPPLGSAVTFGHKSLTGKYRFEITGRRKIEQRWIHHLNVHERTWGMMWLPPLQFAFDPSYFFYSLKKERKEKEMFIRRVWKAFREGPALRLECQSILIIVKENIFVFNSRWERI